MFRTVCKSRDEWRKEFPAERIKPEVEKWVELLFEKNTHYAQNWINKLFIGLGMSPENLKVYIAKLKGYPDMSSRDGNLIKATLVNNIMQELYAPTVKEREEKGNIAASQLSTDQVVRLIEYVKNYYFDFLKQNKIVLTDVNMTGVEFKGTPEDNVKQIIYFLTEVNKRLNVLYEKNKELSMGNVLAKEQNAAHFKEKEDLIISNRKLFDDLQKTEVYSKSALEELKKKLDMSMSNNLDLMAYNKKVTIDLQDEAKKTKILQNRFETCINFLIIKKVISEEIANQCIAFLKSSFLYDTDINIFNGLKKIVEDYKIEKEAEIKRMLDAEKQNIKKMAEITFKNELKLKAEKKELKKFEKNAKKIKKIFEQTEASKKSWTDMELILNHLLYVATKEKEFDKEDEFKHKVGERLSNFKEYEELLNLLITKEKENKIKIETEIANIEKKSRRQV